MRSQFQVLNCGLSDYGRKAKGNDVWKLSIITFLFLQLEKAKSGEAAHRDTVDALQKELEARSESLSSTSNDVEQLNEKISELKNLLDKEKEDAQQVSSVHFFFFSEQI